MDGFEFSDGGEDACAAYLDGDVFKEGGCLFGCKFVGDDGTGGFGGGSGGFLEFDVVEFYDCAVGAVGEVCFDFIKFFDGVPGGFDSVDGPIFFLGREAPCFECLMDIILCFEEGGGGSSRCRRGRWRVFVGGFLWGRAI